MRSISELYDNSRMLMHTGDCLLWRSDTIIGWLIRLLSKGEYNHAGLVIRPSDNSIFYNRRMTLEALGNGIVLRLLSERLYRYKGTLTLFPLKSKYDQLREQIREWAMSKEGTPYDYNSLFKQVFGRVSVNAKDLFCSEYVHAAYKHVGIPIESKKALRPSDIPNEKIFREPIKIYDSSQKNN